MVYKKVLEYCKENKMSIMAFEKLCGLGNAVVSGWESGNPRIETLMKISEATKIPIEDWLKE